MKYDAEVLALASDPRALARFLANLSRDAANNRTDDLTHHLDEILQALRQSTHQTSLDAPA